MEQPRRMVVGWCLFAVLGAALCRSEDGLSSFEDLDQREGALSFLESHAVSPAAPKPLMVGLTLIQGAAAKGADGLRGIHMNLVMSLTVWVEDGVTPSETVFIARQLVEASQLYFRGQKIWLAAMEELISLGMKNADQALLSGCSAGGLASILHCDEFRYLFPRSTKVKCLSDAGMFIDAVDISEGHSLRDIYAGVVSLQNVQVNLPSSCSSHLDPTSCFFPQNLVANIKTPLFLLNAAYDAWQLQSSLAPGSADPHGTWTNCKLNHERCNSSQIEFLQDFRKQMLDAVKDFASSSKNGLFINSCFAHCQSERQDTWFAEDSPLIADKGIAESVGDWYFDRVTVKAIDCAYPCDKTCHNLVFK
ncbi:hypothetical protein CDL15_Pgr023125 [Punica granatum]|uniref:Pectin acetylesterase n=1 Tax=Punica granatum TaxID=22663 RepID=A0A218X443_PUNGR|nr:hypothetical protein CDL15_Pgr023125 [Punica granatum]